jgi:DNA-binding NarL/FixJ family response regulator
MSGGTLLVSRYTNWFPHFKMSLEALGFPDVYVTDREKDGLNTQINELSPRYVLIDSNFYDCGTPYMAGQMLSLFTSQNTKQKMKRIIAVITTSPFPDGIATWFIFHGLDFYVKWSDGLEEFQHGLRCILEGKKYIAPDVQYILDELGEYPIVPLKATKRQKEIYLMLCCGFSIKRIESDLHIGKTTVELHIRELMKIFNSRGREELIKTAYCLEIFSRQDLGFNDTDYNNIKLPEWAVTQRRINQIANGQRARSREQLTMKREIRARANDLIKKKNKREIRRVLC